MNHIRMADSANLDSTPSSTHRLEVVYKTAQSTQITLVESNSKLSKCFLNVVFAHCTAACGFNPFLCEQKQFFSVPSIVVRVCFLYLLYLSVSLGQICGSQNAIFVSVIICSVYDPGFCRIVQCFHYNRRILWRFFIF